MRVEVSFDDGHVSDLKAARMLSERGLRGTFYFPSNQCPRTIQLTLKELKEGIFDRGHEIGGHTVNHPLDMKLLTDDELRFEIRDNKLMLETLITKKPITKFCYPRGRHDERVRQAVKDAGYTEARTTIVGELYPSEPERYGDPLAKPTSVHMFERAEYDGKSWESFADALIDGALAAEAAGAPEATFHLWGHSWELDRDGGWDAFGRILDRLSTIANVANGASRVE